MGLTLTRIMPRLLQSAIERWAGSAIIDSVTQQIRKGDFSFVVNKVSLTEAATPNIPYRIETYQGKERVARLDYVFINRTRTMFVDKSHNGNAPFGPDAIGIGPETLAAFKGIRRAMIILALIHAQSQGLTLVLIQHIVDEEPFKGLGIAWKDVTERRTDTDEKPLTSLRGYFIKETSFPQIEITPVPTSQPRETEEIRKSKPEQLVLAF